MKIILSESQVLRLIKEQTDMEKAASGPQKCAATDAQNKEYSAIRKSVDKEAKKWSKESARMDKEYAKELALKNKNFLSLSYDRDSFPLDKETRKSYQANYNRFMKENPGLLNDGDGFDAEQKYAIITKVLDYIIKVPQISYSVRLNKKFGLNPKSSLKDVINVVNEMGGYTSFMDWFNSGGPEIL